MSQRNKLVKSPESSPNIQVKRAKDSESPNEDKNVLCSSQTDAEGESKVLQE